MSKDLVVYMHREAVGRLRQEDSGRLSFRYGAEWLESDGRSPLSLSLPLQVEAFDDGQVRPFFAGLLPDENARERLARHLGLSHQNPFALLEEVGGECAGAVALMRPDEALPSESGDGQLLDAKTLAAYLKALPRRPLLVGGELRLSLAGAQDKLALVYRDGAFFLPRGQSATTHILKTEIEGFDNTVANEFFCLRLASRLGLDVPAVDMRRVEDVQFLMVERYDRVARGQSIQRLHQEDFCQALGVVPERKYQAEGGPSIVDCFRVLAACRYPARARLEFMRRVILNFLIGNADAHGKNFALLYPAARSKPRLAPLYDVLCTRAYLDHTDRMAMKIGGKRRFDTVLERHWRRLADDVEFAWPGVLRTCMDWSERVPELARKLADELGELGELQVIRRIIEVVDKGAETLPVGR